jgi:hypothetical protein
MTFDVAVEIQDSAQSLKESLEKMNGLMADIAAASGNPYYPQWMERMNAHAGALEKNAGQYPDSRSLMQATMKAVHQELGGISPVLWDDIGRLTNGDATHDQKLHMQKHDIDNVLNAISTLAMHVGKLLNRRDNKPDLVRS